MQPNCRNSIKTMLRSETKPQILLIGLFLVLILLAHRQHANAATTVRATAPAAASQTQEPSNTRLNYFGTFIGKLFDRSSYLVSGEVYAVDEQTIFIKDFHYNGQAPDAYFWSSVTSTTPSAEGGFIVPDEKGSTKPLERYTRKDIVLRLPEGKTLREIHWLSIWSRQLKKSVGDIIFASAPQLLVPRPLEIAPLSQLAHGLRSGPITIVDAQTFLVPDFHYDGLGPDAYFWLSRGGNGLNAIAGNSLRLKDENGSSQPLRKYQGETIVISLPDELTVYDFDHFGVWCRQFASNFGQTQLPQLTQGATKVPPSPKMLGIKPENKLNCEILYDDLGFEIRWVLDGDDIVMQLVGKIEPGEYMAFGLGKDDSRSDMNNADAVVAWVERATGQVHAVDYHLGQTKAQCVNDPKQGSCPDVKLPGGSDSLTLLHGAIVNGYSMVTFKRPQLGVDEQFDQHVYSDGQQSIIWAIGTLNAQKEIGYHRLRTKSNMFIDFARNPQWNCPIPDLNASMHTQPSGLSGSTAAPISSAASQLDQTVVSQAGSSSNSAATADQMLTPVQASGAATPPADQDQEAAWFIPSIVCPSEKTFYAQIGPTGGLRRGLAAVTPSSWYINGLMVPELVLERGQAYKFIVEGGNDKTSPTRRHPLYLTDSQEGGFNFKTDEERQRERLFGGVALRANDGQFVPTAEGRMCDWRPTEQTANNPDVYQTFSAFQRTLSLACVPGQASVLKFVPDSSTPSELFYQCYTHRFMGGRIRVVDSCAQFMASNGLSASGSSVAIQRSNKRRDTLSNRRHSHSSDLVAQTSESRMSFEAPQFGETTLVDSSLNGASEFGDETAASSPQELLAALLASPPPLILNNSQLVNGQQLNMSTLEQILKFSPADLEFLEATETSGRPNSSMDLLGPIDLQQNLKQQQFQLQLFQQQQQQQQQPRNASQNVKGSRVPRGWSAYMRRLASFYYPVQQQLASILKSSNGQHQQQQHQHQQKQQHGNNKPTQEVLPSPSTHSFSLASLVPKSPKIVVDNLSKANFGKKLNKLRFKSGRKIEPNQQAAANNGQQQIRPPTPDNEFNYDIFNNQLAQLERQQKQIQVLESMAAAAAASMSPVQSAPDAPVEQPFGYLHSTNGDDFGSFNPFEVTNNQQQQQQNFHDILQQQQSSPPQQPLEAQLFHREPNENFHLFNNGSRLSGQNEHQAVFVTKLGPTQPYQQVLNSQPGGGGLWHNAPTNNVVYPMFQPYASYQPAPQKQTYNFAATGSEISPQDAPTLAHEMGPPGHQTKLTYTDGTNVIYNKQTRDPLDSSTSTTSTTSAAKNIELDHMLAIERYSKQSSERPSPSVVHPITGETIMATQFQHENEQQLVHHQQQQQQQQQQAAEVANQSSAEQKQHPLANNRHTFASTTPTTSARTNQNSLVEILDSEQSAQTAELTRLNSSGHQSSVVVMASQETPSYVIRNTSPAQSIETASQVSNSSNTTQSTVMISPQITRPASADGNFDFFASGPPVTTMLTPSSSFMVAPNTNAISTTIATHFTASTQPSVGPLVPSLGPPIMPQQQEQQKPQQQQQTDESSLVFRTNLIEPIRSTLVPNTQNAQIVNSFSTGQLDTSPFRPIELVASAPTQQQQQQQQQQIFYQSPAQRLRPPLLIESMFSSYASPLRPEPPVQVASYLAQHFAAQLNNNQQNQNLHQQQQQSQTLVASERSVASNQPVSLSVTIPMDSATSQQTSRVQQQNNSSPIDLIILKPSLIESNQQQLNVDGSRQATYKLKPEFLTTSTGGNGFKPIIDNKLSNNDQSDPMHASASSNGNEAASRRLAGHLFERLSSLSSPPSTSMVLDPMLTSNSITSNKLNKQNLHDFRQQHQLSGNSLDNSSETNNVTLLSEQQAITTTIYGQPRHIPGSLIPLAQPKVGISSAERTNEAQTSSITTNRASPSTGSPMSEHLANLNLLYRDNNTDNAILSHVMSLISSNAIPAPPLLPVTSYSSADYFLPIRDHHNHHIQRSQRRRRSTAT